MSRCWSVLACAFLACGGAGTTDTGSSGMSAGGASSSSSTSAASTVPEPTGESMSSTTVPSTSAGTTGSSSSGDDEDDGAFLKDPVDVPPAFACSIDDQDCERGSKCLPYLAPGGFNPWHHADCFPVDADPVGLGEPCVYEGGPWSGHDNCPANAVCYAPNEQGEGVCRELCPFDPTGYACTEPDANPYVGCQSCGCVCNVSCSPLRDDCADGQVCAVINTFGVCYTDVSGDQGAAGDPCGSAGECDRGLACLGAELVPGCEDGACCTPYCDIAEPVCPEGTVCSQIWEPGDALPELEGLGWCVEETGE